MSKQGLAIRQIGLFALVGVFAFGGGSASAATLSDGGMTFQAITDVSGPEEFSWTVELGDDQELKSIDDQHAGVYWEDGNLAFAINAVPAHDAEGLNVPTTLAVSEGDLITLTVHHRAGNPLAGGAPFVYPITAGAGWEGGFRTYVIAMPPGEFPPHKTCLVPRLKGKTLKAAKRLVRLANCAGGSLRKLKNATARTGRVVKQTPAPGTQLTEGTAVRVTLG